MNSVYSKAVVLAELSICDHKMVLLTPSNIDQLGQGSVEQVLVRCQGHKWRAAFASALTDVRWEPLYQLPSCEDQCRYFHDTIAHLTEAFFPYKAVTRHSTDKPWVTDSFRQLVRKQQRAYIMYMSGNTLLFRGCTETK